MNVAEPLWQNLLNIKKQLQKAAPGYAIAVNEIQFRCYDTATDLFQSEQNWDLVLTREPQDFSGYQKAMPLFNGRAFLYFARSISTEQQQIYRHYIPLAVSHFIFHEDSFLIAHAAQSLDGKMCTVNGASQWIGNDANLVHAHRIRALVDGIIVGANTMRNEHPKLSVRHVAGEDPKRIVLCNSLEGFSERDLHNTIVICSENSSLNQHRNENTDSGPEFVQIASNDSGKLDVTSIRQKLAQMGIQSIMLEGGPCTINQFIQYGGVDWLQIHIAPILFGSGKSIYECESIDCVADALHLQNTCMTQMGDATMLSGEVPQTTGHVSDS